MRVGGKEGGSIWREGREGGERRVGWREAGWEGERGCREGVREGEMKGGRQGGRKGGTEVEE